jgi:uncharacterized membrane protein YpjA
MLIMVNDVYDYGHQVFGIYNALHHFHLKSLQEIAGAVLNKLKKLSIFGMVIG